ncbi:MAG: DUF885 family protein [Pseudomonadota bacterium]
MSRRRALVGLGASGLVPVLGGCGPTGEATSERDRRHREIGRVLDEISRLAIEVDPEAVTRLGLSGRGAPGWTATRLSSRSQAGFERSRLDRIATLKRLSALPLADEGSRLRTHQIAIMGAFERAVAVQAFGFGRVSLADARPYVADHMGGSYLDVPRLLLSRQPVNSVADADAYLQRLAALPPTIRDEQRRMEADAVAEIRPPRTVLSRLAAKAAALAVLPVEGHPMLRDLANRTEALTGLSDEARQDMLVAASRVIAGPLADAYRNLAGRAGTLFEGASDLPGLSAFQTGPDYFNVLLTSSLLTQANPEDLMADIDVRVRTAQRELKDALDRLELAPGPVKARLEALDGLVTVPAGAPADAAEAAGGGGLTTRGLVTALSNDMATLRPRLRQIMARLPDAEAVVTLSPQDLWAPYDHDDMTYEPAAADGSLSGTLRVRPGLEGRGVPALLPTLYREGVPGRHLARAVAIEDTAQPLLRHLTHPKSFEDAWAAYGLDLAEEISRTDDPVADAFRLRADLGLLIEAVVDLGIHGLGWTSAAAIEALSGEGGYSSRDAVDTLWRVAVEPGRAVSAVFGRSVFRALRTRADTRLGNDFDPAAFHFTLLTTGPRPFSQVQAEMEDWASAQVG